MTDRAFAYVIFIESTPEKTWQALTDGAFTRRFWAGRRVASDWTVGANVHFYLEDSDEFEVSGRVLECTEPKRLSYTWKGRNEGQAEETVVTFEIHPIGDSVRLTVHHEPLDPDAQARQGWAAILSSLKSFVEKGRPLSATEMWLRAA